MPEYLYRNDNNDERTQTASETARRKKHGRLVYNIKTENDITRFYRRFTLAQLHWHMTAVNLFKEKKETAFHQ